MTHRLLATLGDYGLVEQLPTTRQYRLGLHLFELGMAVLHGRTIYSEAIPHLEALTEQTGYRSHLALLEGAEVIYLYSTLGKRYAPPPQPQGWRRPASCSALGKVLLAYLPASQLDHVLTSTSFERFTEFTITTPTALRQELHATRQRGYGLDVEESQLGGCCVAAPIRDEFGSIVAAISLSWISRAELEANRSAIAQATVETADRVSQQIGYFPANGAFALTVTCSD